MPVSAEYTTILEDYNFYWLATGFCSMRHPKCVRIKGKHVAAGWAGYGAETLGRIERNVTDELSGSSR